MDNLEKLIQIELAVIGAYLANPKLQLDDSEGLAGSDFYYSENRKVWELIAKTLEVGNHADALTVHNDLNLPLSEVASWVMSAPSSKATVKTHAKAIKTAATLRKMTSIGQHITELAESNDGLSIAEKMDACQNLLLGLTSSAVEREAVHIKEVMIEVVREIQRKYDTGDCGITGLPTGVKPLDDSTQGLQPGHLVVVAGRSSMGKTSLALQMAIESGLNNKPVLFFSMEMTAEDIGVRKLSNLGDLPLEKLAHGKAMYADEMEKMQCALGRFYTMPLHIDSQSGMTVQQIKARAKQHKAKHGLSLVVIDQLSFIKTAKDRRSEAYGDITKALKALANELSIPVVLLHQLNRSTASEGRRPQLHDLKDSGSVEEDADLVILIHRPGYYDDAINQSEVELIIAKNRMGPRESVRCGWVGSSAKFIDAPIPDDRPFSDSSKPTYKRGSLK
jgi:replicative DNA helicase